MKQDLKAIDAKHADHHKPGGRQRGNNLLIREALREYGLCQWELADIMGVREETLSRMLRRELPISEQYAIIALIGKEG